MTRVVRAAVRAAERARQTSYDAFLLRHAAGIVQTSWTWPVGRVVAWLLCVHAALLDARQDRG